VILVDDDPPSLEVMTELVTRWEFRAEGYGSFEEGRAALLREPADALIVDVRLGAFNGLHLAHLARRQSETMTIIAVSGFDDSVLREEASSIHASYLVKPIEPQQLRDILFHP